MQYGFKKGHGPLRPAKKIYVFKFVGVYEGAREAEKATGIEAVKIQHLAKTEKMKDGYLLTYNQQPGQDFKAF